MASKQKPIRVVIMGAAGRDFHNFNMVYRDDPVSRVVAFTASQVPEIAGRRYPTSLAYCQLGESRKRYWRHAAQE